MLYSSQKMSKHGAHSDKKCLTTPNRCDNIRMLSENAPWALVLTTEEEYPLSPPAIARRGQHKKFTATHRLTLFSWSGYSGIHSFCALSESTRTAGGRRTAAQRIMKTKFSMIAEQADESGRSPRCGCRAHVHERTQFASWTRGNAAPLKRDRFRKEHCV